MFGDQHHHIGFIGRPFRNAHKAYPNILQRSIPIGHPQHMFSMHKSGRTLSDDKGLDHIHRCFMIGPNRLKTIIPPLLQPIGIQAITPLMNMVIRTITIRIHMVKIIPLGHIVRPSLRHFCQSIVPDQPRPCPTFFNLDIPKSRAYRSGLLRKSFRYSNAFFASRRSVLMDFCAKIVFTHNRSASKMNRIGMYFL